MTPVRTCRPFNAFLFISDAGYPDIRWLVVRSTVQVVQGGFVSYPDLAVRW